MSFVTSEGPCFVNTATQSNFDLLRVELDSFCKIVVRVRSVCLRLKSVSKSHYSRTVDASAARALDLGEQR